MKTCPGCDELNRQIRTLELEHERALARAEHLAGLISTMHLRIRELTPQVARLRAYEHSRLGVRPEPLSVLIDDPSGDDVAPDATPEDRRRLH